MLKGIILSLVMSMIWVGAHILIVHTKPPRRHFFCMVGLFVLTLAVLSLIYFLVPYDLFGLFPYCDHTLSALGLIAALLTHTLFFCTCVEFFYYIERSVTLRLLVEFSKMLPCSLTKVRNVYSVDKMVSDRLAVMHDNGFVQSSNGLWFLTDKGKLFAKIFILFRKMLNLSPGQ